MRGLETKKGKAEQLKPSSERRGKLGKSKEEARERRLRKIYLGKGAQGFKRS